MSNERDVLVAEAVLGRDAAEFLRGELWKYIDGRIEMEVTEAQDALALVSPWRRNRIRQLQNAIWRAREMRGWLNELVTSGDAAEALLSDTGQDE